MTKVRGMAKDKEKGVSMTTGELHVIRDILEEVKAASKQKRTPEIPKEWADFAWNAIKRAMKQTKNGDHQTGRNRSVAKRTKKRDTLLPQQGKDASTPNSAPNRPKKITLFGT